MEIHELYEIAKETLNPRNISRNGEAAHVASALLTKAGNVYTGVAITVPCSVGFCAEHSAIAAMVTAGESKIVKIVSVYEDGDVLPPCGRCREFISQIDDDNENCEILLPDNVMKTLGELLPDRWDYKWN